MKRLIEYLLWRFRTGNNNAWRLLFAIIVFVWFCINVRLFDIGKPAPDPLTDQQYYDIYLHGAAALDQSMPQEIPSVIDWERYSWYGWIFFASLIFLYNFITLGNKFMRGVEIFLQKILERRSARQDVKEPKTTTVTSATTDGSQAKSRTFTRELIKEFLAEAGNDILIKLIRRR